MRMRRWVLGVLAALTILAAPGCGGSPLPVKSVQQAKPAAPKPVCAHPPVKGKPALCLLDDGTTYIVGLSAEHAWKPGSWVLLSVEHPGLTERWPAALAIVKKAWADVGEVSILCQREAKIDGAQARVIRKDERAPLGKFVGYVKEVQKGQARVDVGSADGVVAGDVYELRAGLESDQSIGQIRVSEVGDMWASGVVLGQTAPVTNGTTVVFKSAPAPAPVAGPVKIMVVNFDPTDSQDALGKSASSMQQTSSYGAP